jgi:hypothetical protein
MNTWFKISHVQLPTPVSSAAAINTRLALHASCRNTGILQEIAAAAAPTSDAPGTTTGGSQGLESNKPWAAAAQLHI